MGVWKLLLCGLCPRVPKVASEAHSVFVACSCSMCVPITHVASIVTVGSVRLAGLDFFLFSIPSPNHSIHQSIDPWTPTLAFYFGLGPIAFWYATVNRLILIPFWLILLGRSLPYAAMRLNDISPRPDTVVANGSGGGANPGFTTDGVAT
jgi:hypothetical protein